jgi:hypothetical protein
MNTRFRGELIALSQTYIDAPSQTRTGLWRQVARILQTFRDVYARSARREDQLGALLLGDLIRGDALGFASARGSAVVASPIARDHQAREPDAEAEGGAARPSG